MYSFMESLGQYFHENENVWISTKHSLKFVPKGAENNIPALVQLMAWRLPCDKLMAWRLPGDKPLSELMVA